MFFRNSTDSASGRRPASRSASSTEAQLKELRNKARRRLIGALALVLAAVIIVPPLFDHTPPAEQHEPIVVPAAPSGLANTEPAGQGAAGSISADDAASTAAATSPQTPDAGSVTADAQTAPAPAGAAGSVAGMAPSPPPATAAAEPAAPPKVAEKPSKPATHEAPASKRTDDGSVALALLAGKMPATSVQKPAASSAHGNFVLQVAAYTTEQDANQRRAKLVESGVTNSYVERAQSGDKTVYRLRVGPFTSHEAAQASQTRLRALGYQNGMISSK